MNDHDPHDRMSDIVVLIDLRARAGSSDTLVETLTRALHGTDASAFTGGRILVDSSDPSRIRMLQSWTSRSAFDAHMRAAGGFAALQDLLDGEPGIEDFTVVAVRPDARSTAVTDV